MTLDVIGEKGDEENTDGSAAPEAGVIAAGGVPKVIVEDAGLAVTERDFDQGESPDHGRILLLHDHPGTPFGVPVVYNPVSYFQI